MSTVAEQLRRAREARNMAVEQVAEITKMRSDHVRALEEGNFDVFSAPVYIRGFVRSYSTLLKLDVPQIMAALDAELGQTTRFAEPPPLSSERRTLVDILTLQFAKVDWRKGVVVLGVLALLAFAALIYASWRHQRTTDPLKNLKPGVYQNGKQRSGETLPLPTPPAKK